MNNTKVKITLDYVDGQKEYTAEEVYSVQGEFAFLNQFEPKTYASYINNVKKIILNTL